MSEQPDVKKQILIGSAFGFLSVSIIFITFVSIHVFTPAFLVPE